MRITRISAALVTAALVVGGLLVGTVSAPASAVATHATKVTLTPDRTNPIYGEYNALKLEVTDTSTGDHVYHGTLSLQKMVKGSWKTVKTYTDDGYDYYTLTNLKPSAAFRAVYSGGSNGYDTNYTGSTSATKTIKVHYALSISAKSAVGGPVVTIAEKPKLKGVKILIEKKHGSKWKKYAAKRTDKHGKVKLKLKGKSGSKWRITAKTSHGLYATSTKGTTT